MKLRRSLAMSDPREEEQQQASEKLHMRGNKTTRCSRRRNIAGASTTHVGAHHWSAGYVVERLTQQFAQVRILHFVDTSPPASPRSCWRSKMLLG